MIKKDKMSNFIYQLLLIACVVCPNLCVRCNRYSLENQRRNGSIESLNYPKEYGEKGSCKWDFAPHINYSLVLKFVGLRLYFARRNSTAKGNATRYCPHAYNLTINGEAIDCTRLVSNNTKTFCKAYYKDKLCSNQQWTQQCESNDLIEKDRTTVQYSASGLKSDKKIGPVFGFKIEYRYIRCTPETAIVAETTDSQTTFSMSVETTSNKRLQSTYLPSLGGIFSTIRNEPEETTILYTTDVANDASSMLVNVLVPISIVLLLVALAILIVVLKRLLNISGGLHRVLFGAKFHDIPIKFTGYHAFISSLIYQLQYFIFRKKQKQSGNPAKSNQSNAVASSSNQSGGGIYSAAEDINLQMGGASPSYQSQQGQSSHVSSFNPSDVAYSTVEKIQGTKQTVEYHKTMVDNVLYGETGGGSVDAQKKTPDAPT
ncbi:uncharacterized protein LOC144424253 [Styela clava]